MWRKKSAMGILGISILLLKIDLDPNVFGRNTLVMAASKCTATDTDSLVDETILITKHQHQLVILEQAMKDGSLVWDNFQ